MQRFPKTRLKLKKKVNGKRADEREKENITPNAPAFQQKEQRRTYGLRKSEKKAVRKHTFGMMSERSKSFRPINCCCEIVSVVHVLSATQVA